MEKLLSNYNKGEIAVLRVELEANLRGYHVSVPKNSQSRYDLIIDTGKKLLRAQIKYLNRRNAARPNALVLMIETPGRNTKAYQRGEIDILLVYIPSKDCILCFNADQFHNKKQVWINTENEKSPSYYKKYLW